MKSTDFYENLQTIVYSGLMSDPAKGEQTVYQVRGYKDDRDELNALLEKLNGKQIDVLGCLIRWFLDQSYSFQASISTNQGDSWVAAPKGRLSGADVERIVEQELRPRPASDQGRRKKSS